MCLYVGLWWPLASKDSMASELDVLALRLLREADLEELRETEEQLLSESDSGTVSS